MKKTIGIIGGGNMGEALIKGLRLFYSVYVCEANSERVNFLKTKYRISYEKNINSLVSKVNIIILAVKPQEMEQVLSQIKITKDKLFISIAAGLTTKYFEERLGGKVRVIRAMPNLPALSLEGTTGFCRGRFATSGDVSIAGKILSALSEDNADGNGVGGAIPFKESQMDAVTAVSGSGPAYVFLFVEQWIKAAQNLGLNEKDAKNLVYETLIGSSHLLKKVDFTAGDLRAKVTSKGGTTEAAMKVFLNKNAFGNLMKEALVAAEKQSKELAK